MTTVAQKPRLYLLFAGLAFAAALAVHLPFLSGELLWDDEQFLASNSFATDCASLGTALNPAYLVKVLPVPMSARPVVNASLVAEACGGMGPRGMKATNALLHAFNSALLFFLLLLLCGSAPGALLGALAFALHPAVAETVHIITFRSHLLGFFFFIAGLIAALLYARKPSVLVGGAAAIAYLLGVLSIETAAVLPAAAALVVYFDSGRSGLKRAAPLLAFYVLIGAFFLWFHAPRSGYDLDGGKAGVQKQSALYPASIFPEGYTPPYSWDFPPPWRDIYSDRAANLYTMSAITLQNLRTLGLPYKLSADYSPGVINEPLKGLPLLAVCLGLLGCGIRLFLRGRPGGLAMLIIFTALLPSMNIWPIYNLRADRYLYLPLAGLALLIAAAAKSAAVQQGLRKHLPLAVAALWLTWLGAATLRRGPQFRDTLTLFTAAQQASPFSPRAWATLGAAWLRQGACGKATAHFESASALYPESSLLRLRFAYALVWCGNRYRAQPIVENLPESPDSLYLSGLLAIKADRGRAAELIRSALEAAPGRRDISLALFLAEKNNPAGLDQRDRQELERMERALKAAGLLL